LELEEKEKIEKLRVKLLEMENKELERDMKLQKQLDKLN